ncbi:MAG: hypothetical protein AAFP19_02375 [Bacteroidota bacterium]
MKSFNLYTGLLWFCLILPIYSYGQDPHIDPSAKKHRHPISFTVHPDATYSDAIANGALSFATTIVERCDNRVNNDQDVACQVSFSRSGTLGSFGMAGDGLDIITTATERRTVLDESSAYVKIVTSILVRSNGTPGSVLGTADLNASTMILRSNLGGANRTGEILAHEFGHNKGFLHRGVGGAPAVAGDDLMRADVAIGGLHEINQTECLAFHTGGVDNGVNRPVDVAFIIDDTGSMGEEIAGVRNALLRILNGYNSSSCETVFQLVTFKDNVSIRQPTTDLNIIRNQVNARRLRVEATVLKPPCEQ